MKSYEKISTNILTDRLERLTAAGLVIKVPTRVNSTRNAYELTAKGQDMLPVLLEMIAWSAQYDSYPDGTALIAGAPADLLERIRSDRPALIEDLLAHQT